MSQHLNRVVDVCYLYSSCPGVWLEVTPNHRPVNRSARFKIGINQTFPEKLFHGVFNHGSMANSLPQAIGAQVAFPGRQVITLSGDGGLAMLLGEILTLRQLKLPVKIVVFNNSSLSFVEPEMKAAGLFSFGTDLLNPDFARLAEAAGILRLRVEKPEELRPALAKALQHDGPALVEVIVNRQELSIPPTITAEQALGFSLYMVKAVLNGRGDEVIDMLKTNLVH